MEVKEAVDQLLRAAGLDPNKTGQVELRPGILRAEVLDRYDRDAGRFVTHTETRTWEA